MLDECLKPVKEIGAILDSAKRFGERLAQLKGTDSGKIFFVRFDSVRPGADQPAALARWNLFVRPKCIVGGPEGFPNFSAR